MKFTEHSALVKVWVRMVESGTYKREDVPKLANLRDVVYWILDGKEVK